ncbi:MAG: hypothetical protein ACRC56_09960 [Bosea sp. (in: a-proteobacteria)]
MKPFVFAVIFAALAALGANSILGNLQRPAAEAFVTSGVRL